MPSLISRLPWLAVVSMSCLVALVGVQLFSDDALMGRYLEAALLVGFGAWRLFTERDRYQRRRITFLVVGVSLCWYVLPLTGILVPRIGAGSLEGGAAITTVDPFEDPGAPVTAKEEAAAETTYDFPSIHVFGSLTFFLFLIPILLFGKGADCGWFCPCVGLRETVGHAFRNRTPRGPFWWRLRHLKWPAMLAGLALIPLPHLAGAEVSDRVEGHFYSVLFYGYYVSFLLMPLLGNRSFCRFVCPFAALWGLVGRTGFYRMEANQQGCTGCGSCEAVCDMGIPIVDLLERKGSIRTAECMGCGRCVEACPREALELRDVRGRRKIPGRGASMRCSSMVILASVALLTAAARPAMAQEEDTAVYTVDPFEDTDDPVVSEEEAVAEETPSLVLIAGYGYTHRKGFSSSPASEEVHSWSLGAEYRLSGRYFAGFSVPYESESFEEFDARGLADISTYAGADLPCLPVTLSALLMLPTGEYEQGLGTGELSGGLSLELPWTVGVVDGKLGGYYLLVGDPEGEDLPDSYGAGLRAGLRPASWMRLGMGVDWSYTSLITREEVHLWQASARLALNPIERLLVVPGLAVELHPTTAFSPTIAVVLGI